MTRVTLLSITITLILLVSGCTDIKSDNHIDTQTQLDPQSTHTTLIIFTAASLVAPFNEIGENYKELNPAVDIIFNFAGSQQLAHQIAQGAPCDIFASADLRQMEAVVQSGRIDPQSTRVFTHNHLVVIFPSENLTDIQNLNDLAKPGLKLVLAAESVPVGNYSLKFISKASQNSFFGQNFQQNVLANVVSYEANVKAVLSKILLGEADAGIVYTSDITVQNVNQLGIIPIPEELNITADYFIAQLNDSHHPEKALEFINYVISSDGQEVLSKHGFITVE
jgi:molybdate transport system substrate-binding protein